MRERTPTEAVEMAGISAIENEMATEGQGRGTLDYFSWLQLSVRRALRHSRFYAEQYKVSERELRRYLRSR